MEIWWQNDTHAFSTSHKMWSQKLTFLTIKLCHVPLIPVIKRKWGSDSQTPSWDDSCSGAALDTYTLFLWTHCTPVHKFVFSWSGLWKDTSVFGISPSLQQISIVPSKASTSVQMIAKNKWKNYELIHCSLVFNHDNIEVISDGLQNICQILLMHYVAV